MSKIKEIDVWVTPYIYKKLCNNEKILTNGMGNLFSTKPEHESEVKVKLVIEVPEKKIEINESDSSNPEMISSIVVDGKHYVDIDFHTSSIIKLEKSIDELQKVLKMKEYDYSGAMFDYNDMKDQRDKLQKALDIAMEVIEFGCELNSYSVAVSIKYRCNEAKKEIENILKGGDDE